MLVRSLGAALIELLKLENLSRLALLWTTVVALVIASDFYELFTIAEPADVEITVQESYLIHEEMVLEEAGDPTRDFVAVLIEDLVEDIRIESDLTHARWERVSSSRTDLPESDIEIVRSEFAFDGLALPVHVMGGRTFHPPASEELRLILLQEYGSQNRATPAYAEVLGGKMAKTEYGLSVGQVQRFIELFKAAEYTDGTVTVEWTSEKVKEMAIEVDGTQCSAQDNDRRLECSFSRDTWAVPKERAVVTWQEPDSTRSLTPSEALRWALWLLGAYTLVWFIGTWRQKFAGDEST